MTRAIREAIICLRERLEQLHIGPNYMFCGVHPEVGKFCLVPNNSRTNLSIWLKNEQHYRFGEISEIIEYIINDTIKYTCPYSLDFIIYNTITRKQRELIMTNIIMLHQLVDVASASVQIISIGSGVAINIKKYFIDGYYN